MSATFTSSDYYVLKNALDRAVLEARANIRVRTQTLFEIGAGHMVAEYDKMAYESMDDSIKDRHVSDVLTHPLKALVDTLECPKDDADEVPLAE